MSVTTAIATWTRYSALNGLVGPPQQWSSAVSRNTSSSSTAGTSHGGTRRIVHACISTLLNPVTAMIEFIASNGRLR